jgi:hypothetical protein
MANSLLGFLICFGIPTVVPIAVAITYRGMNKAEKDRMMSSMVDDRRRRRR